MKKEYVMGNGAIALGALSAGVNLVTGYPGTPSSEILENIQKYSDGSVHIEWSVNEKSAMEVAASASYSGARTLVTMKQVGLNVASDPLMSLAYVGVKEEWSLYLQMIRARFPHRPSRIPECLRSSAGFPFLIRHLRRKPFR